MKRLTRPSMMKVIHAAWHHGSESQCRALYARSDGYGSAGYIPAQGYDWSGIRDSSDDAVRSMYATARRILRANHLGFNAKGLCTTAR